MNKRVENKIIVLFCFVLAMIISCFSLSTEHKLSNSDNATTEVVSVFEDLTCEADN